MSKHKVHFSFPAPEPILPDPTTSAINPIPDVPLEPQPDIHADAATIIQSLASTAPCCANCRYYVAATCHRNPPQILRISTDNVSIWPQVGTADWCGEFNHA
jgi:hypothetical protein